MSYRHALMAKGDLMTERTEYVLDSNVVMDDFRVIETINENLLIPITVIHELENHKSDLGDVGYNSRNALKLIDSAMSNNDTLENGKRIVFDADEYPEIVLNDDKIIETVSVRNSVHDEAVLMTNDVAMRVKARILDIETEPYLKQQEEYNSIGKINYEDVSSDVIDGIYSKIEEKSEGIADTYKENDLIVARTGSQSAMCKIKNESLEIVVPPVNLNGSISPRNVGQRFFGEMLLDENKSVILATGKAGSGKTLLSLAAACDYFDNQLVDQIVCVKVQSEVGDEVGFLPGELQEKIAPHQASFNDNLKVLFPKSFKRKRKDSIGKPKSKAEADNDNLFDVASSYNIMYEPITFLRGRTFTNSFLIIDECQNLTPHQIKTIISRCGKGCKIVLLGDVTQIDNHRVDKYTNGLFYAQKKLCQESLVGCINLEEIERGAIAVLADKL